MSGFILVNALCVAIAVLVTIFLGYTFQYINEEFIVGFVIGVIQGAFLTWLFSITVFFKKV